VGLRVGFVTGSGGADRDCGGGEVGEAPGVDSVGIASYAPGRLRGHRDAMVHHIGG
jgi:hypothetical protein